MSKLFNRILRELEVVTAAGVSFGCKVETAKNLRAMVKTLEADYNDAIAENDKLTADLARQVARYIEHYGGGA